MMGRAPCYVEAHLTGRARVRPGWRLRPILQVEVSTLEYSASPPMPGRNPAEWDRAMRAQGTTTLSWRDATWEDFAQPSLTIAMAPAAATQGDS